MQMQIQGLRFYTTVRPKTLLGYVAVNMIILLQYIRNEYRVKNSISARIELYVLASYTRTTILYENYNKRILLAARLCTIKIFYRFIVNNIIFQLSALLILLGINK